MQSEAYPLFYTHGLVLVHIPKGNLFFSWSRGQDGYIVKHTEYCHPLSTLLALPIER